MPLLVLLGLVLLVWVSTMRGIRGHVFVVVSVSPRLGFKGFPVKPQARTPRPKQQQRQGDGSPRERNSDEKATSLSPS